MTRFLEFVQCWKRTWYMIHRNPAVCPITLSAEQLARLDAAHDTVDEMLPEEELRYVFAIGRALDYFDDVQADTPQDEPGADYPPGAMYG
jgi:hypothetical protein